MTDAQNQTPQQDENWLAANKMRIVSIIRGAGDLCGFMSGMNAVGLWERLGRSSALGTSVSGAILGALIKEKEMTLEEYQKLSRMSTPEYLKTKFFYALNPLSHIRETVASTIAITGMGLMVSGISSDPARLPEMGIGLTAFTGGALLGLSKESKYGWQWMGSLFGVTMLPLDVLNGIDATSRGDYWVTAMAACYVGVAVACKLVPDMKTLEDVRKQSLESHPQQQK